MLPTALLVTSAPGRTPTLGLSRGKDGPSVAAPAGAWQKIQLVGRGRASGRGWGRRQSRPKARPLSQMLTQLRAPGPRGAREVLTPPPALGFLQR